MAVFTPEERNAFLWGEWVACESSNVREIKYDPEEETLQIGYGKPGGPVTYYEYQDVWPEMAELFANAPSKGVWTWEYLKRTGWPYTKLL